MRTTFIVGNLGPICTVRDFVAYEKLTTGLRHELFLANQTHNSLTIVVYVGPKSCRRPVVNLLYETKVHRVNHPFIGRLANVTLVINRLYNCMLHVLFFLLSLKVDLFSCNLFI